MWVWVRSLHLVQSTLHKYKLSTISTSYKINAMIMILSRAHALDGMLVALSCCFWKFCCFTVSHSESIHCIQHESDINEKFRCGWPLILSLLQHPIWTYSWIAQVMDVQNRLGLTSSYTCKDFLLSVCNEQPINNWSHCHVSFLVSMEVLTYKVTEK